MPGPGQGCAPPPRPVRSWVGPPRPRWPNACAKRPNGIARPDGSEPARQLDPASGRRPVRPCRSGREFSRQGEESQIKPGPGRAQHGTGNQVNRDVLLGGQRGIQDAETPEPTQAASQTAIAEVPGQAINANGREDGTGRVEGGADVARLVDGDGGAVR